jgi:hypothetical protein
MSVHVPTIVMDSSRRFRKSGLSISSAIALSHCLAAGFHEIKKKCARTTTFTARKRTVLYTACAGDLCVRKGPTVSSTGSSARSTAASASLASHSAPTSAHPRPDVPLERVESQRQGSDVNGCAATVEKAKLPDRSDDRQVGVTRKQGKRK